MADAALTRMTIGELSRLIEAKQVSPVEVTEAHLERIEAANPLVNAFVTRLDDHALAAARQAEKEIATGDYRGPLHGIPIGLKDLYWTKGIRTTSGSTVDKDFVPSEDSAVAERLAQAGTILMGKLHTVEFAFGAKEHNPAYGDPRNPWDLSRIPGGSSSGSGAAVAARMLPMAMGSDTAGSVRQPACLSGVTGLKPSYGLVSRYGITPISATLDHAGPLVRSAEDAGLVMNAITGHDPRDPGTVAREAEDYTEGIGDGIRGLRMGIPWDYINEAVDPQVEAAFRAAVEVLESLGASVEEVSIPEFRYSGAMLIAIAGTEAVDVHYERFRDRDQAGEFNQVIRRRMESARFLPAPLYVRAQRVRRLLGIRLAQTFQRVDLLALPSLGITALPLGAETVTIRGRSFTEQEVITRTMHIFNMNGIPAISVPCGFDDEGLPVGLQLAGPLFEDRRVLRAANAYQEATAWHTKIPALGDGGA